MCPKQCFGTVTDVSTSPPTPVHHASQVSPPHTPPPFPAPVAPAAALAGPGRGLFPVPPCHAIRLCLPCLSDYLHTRRCSGGRLLRARRLPAKSYLPAQLEPRRSPMLPLCPRSFDPVVVEAANPSPGRLPVSLVIPEFRPNFPPPRALPPLAFSQQPPALQPVLGLPAPELMLLPS